MNSEKLSPKVCVCVGFFLMKMEVITERILSKEALNTEKVK